MVDEEPPADSGSGMNFDACQEATDVGNKTSWESELMSPQEVGGTMKPESMEAWIEKDDLPCAPRRWVPSKNCLDIFS